MARRRTLWAGVAVWLVFLAYLRWVVPLIEGQSADQVPRIDLLGSLRIEQPGQWLSIFPPDSWQRDETNRNMIHADGNIVLFQSFQHESNSTLRVKGLTLLLFDPDATSRDREPTDQEPVVIESLDEAVLTFEAGPSGSLNRYGDLKRVEFLGLVKFWRRGPTRADAFALETTQLTITGGQASTESAVRFQFGDSTGLATGLELTFENPESLHLANATLTKIAGLRHVRLGQVNQLDLKTAGGPTPGSGTATAQRSQHVRLRSDGPAEFSFAHRAARFHRQVQVFDFGSRCWLTGEALLVQFEAEEPATAIPSKPPRQPGVPEGLTARELWMFGGPAVISDADQEFQLTATSFRFVIPEQLFVAGPLPKSGVEPWMRQAVQGSPDHVEFLRETVLLRTPQLQYRMGETSPQATAVAGAGSFGTLESLGPGQLWSLTQGQASPVELRWRERMTVTPDPDDARRLLASLLGGTRVNVDAQTTVTAESLFFWLQNASDSGGDSVNPSPRWLPDLIFARGNVRMEGDKLRAAVREARVYFPSPPEPTPATSSERVDAMPGPRPGGGIELAAASAPTGVAGRIPVEARSGTSRPEFEPASVPTVDGLDRWAPPPRRAPQPGLAQAASGGSVSPGAVPRDVQPAGSSLAQRGADITAESLVVQLEHATPFPSDRSSSGRAQLGGAFEPGLGRPGTDTLSGQPDSGAGQYRVQTIDLEGQVVVEERGWEENDLDRTGGPATLDPTSAYRMYGHRIVGIASEAVPPTARLAGDGPAAPPDFIWSLLAQPGQMARLDNAEFELLAPEVQFDQRQNVAWTTRPGTLRFVVPAQSDVAGANESTSDPVTGGLGVRPATGTALAPGRGTARWERGFQFDGRQLLLDGQVEWEMERPKSATQMERLQGFSERLTIELSETVSMGTDAGPSARPVAKRIRMASAVDAQRSGETAPIRLSMQLVAADQSLLTHERILAKDVDLDLARSTFDFRGPGTLWTVRSEAAESDGRSRAPSRPSELTYLKVQFQRSMEGHWGEGVVNLLGPVSALYGKAVDWQILDNEGLLLSPLKINSDTMSLNRWQASPQSPFELEWEADGRVHVWGEQFEGTARRINYAQAQDLLTLRGDSRGPAKFWQTTPGGSSPNHLAAQKIWYRPKHEDFHFEGFQEGNLNFFSGRRGAAGPTGDNSRK